jgi:hypothetical protein
MALDDYIDSPDPSNPSDGSGQAALDLINKAVNTPVGNTAPAPKQGPNRNFNPNTGSAALDAALGKNQTVLAKDVRGDGSTKMVKVQTDYGDFMYPHKGGGQLSGSIIKGYKDAIEATLSKQGYQKTGQGLDYTYTAKPYDETATNLSTLSQELGKSGGIGGIIAPGGIGKNSLLNFEPISNAFQGLRNTSQAAAKYLDELSPSEPNKDSNGNVIQYPDGTIQRHVGTQIQDLDSSMGVGSMAKDAGNIFDKSADPLDRLTGGVQTGMNLFAAGHGIKSFLSGIRNLVPKGLADEALTGAASDMGSMHGGSASEYVKPEPTPTQVKGYQPPTDPNYDTAVGQTPIDATLSSPDAQYPRWQDRTKGYVADIDSILNTPGAVGSNKRQALKNLKSELNKSIRDGQPHPGIVAEYPAPGKASPHMPYDHGVDMSAIDGGSQDNIGTKTSQTPPIGPETANIGQADGTTANGTTDSSPTGSSPGYSSVEPQGGSGSQRASGVVDGGLAGNEATGSNPSNNVSLVDGTPVKVKQTFPASAPENPTIHEVVDPENFAKAINQAKESQGSAGASLNPYSPEDYAKMRTFLISDGTAGFAIKDGEIVSVFKHADSPHSNVAKSLLDVAVKEGGNRLDAFDGQLPKIYSKSGFKAVARLPWDDAHAPDGWDFSAEKSANGGRPDVVFMVHDPEGVPTYRTGDGVKVNTHEEGVAAQKAALEGKTAKTGAVETTGISNAAHLSEVEQGLLDKAPDPQGRSAKEIYEANRDRTDYQNIANNVEKGKAFNPDDAAAAIAGKGKLMQAQKAARGAFETARDAGTSPESLQRLRDAYQEARDNTMTYVQQLQKGKGMWSDVGRVLGLDIGVDTGDVESSLLHAEMNKNSAGVTGKSLSERTAAKITAQANKIKELTDKISKMNADGYKVNQTAIQKTRGARTITLLNSEFQDLSAQLAKQASKLHSGLDPEILVTAGKMVANRIEWGAKTVAEAVSPVLEAIRQHFPDATEREIRDAYSGYAKEKAVSQSTALPPSEKQVANQRASALKSQMVNQSKLEDLQAGKVPITAKKTPAFTPDNEAIQGQNKEAGQINSATKSVQQYKKNIETLQSGGTLTKAEPPHPFSKAVEDLRKERDALHAKQIALIENQRPGTFFGGVKNYVRTNVLSGPGTLGNLAAYSVGAAASAPLEEIGAPLLRKVLPAAGTETMSSIQAEGAALKAWLDLDTWKSSYQALSDGTNHLKAEAIRLGLENEHAAKNPVLEALVRVHQAEKTPLQTSAFAREYVKQLKSAADAGIDITDDVRMKAWAQAYAKSKEAILMNSNETADAWSSFTRKAFGGSTQPLSPIVRVPLNFAGRSVEYAGLGILPGIGRQIYSKMSGIALEAGAQQAIARAYKRGGLGLALTYVGANLPSDWAKVDDQGHLIIGGHKMISAVSHIIPLQMLKAGIIYRDSQAEGGIEKAKDAAFQTAKNIATHIPFIDQAKEISRALTNQPSLGKVAGTIAGGLTVPKLISYPAQQLDNSNDVSLKEAIQGKGIAEHRSPQGFKDAYKMNIPGDGIPALNIGGRNSVPTKGQMTMKRSLLREIMGTMRPR